MRSCWHHYLLSLRSALPSSYHLADGSTDFENRGWDVWRGHESSAHQSVQGEQTQVFICIQFGDYDCELCER